MTGSSETPRTDAHDQGLYGYSDYRREYPKLLKTSRTLEIELSALKAKIEAAGKELPEEPECLRLWHLGH